MQQHFDPNVCVVCEIPPLKDAVQKNENKVRSGSGVLIFATKHFSPKIRNDLNKFSNQVENLCISLKLPQKQNLLIKLTYSPRKQQSMQFLDELASNIIKVVSGNETIVLVRGYNNKFFIDVEKQSLETILTP